MNARERWIETLRYGRPDRIPLMPGKGRESTLARWHREGLPQDIPEHYHDITEYAYRQIGGRLDWPAAPEGFPLNERMIPCFEEKVIEEKSRTHIVQDWKGNICEISKRYSVKYLREGIDFVTRKWIKCPVESRRDWEQMKNRYHSDDPARWPSDMNDRVERLSHRDNTVHITLSGPFWQLREWLGFEALCMCFHDDPNLIRDMISFWEDFISQLLTKTFEHIVPDFVLIAEDMAYKKFSMISPDMIRRFILPTWSCWGRIVHDAGCPLYAVDSDGFIGELIPVWIEAGFDACEPIEVAAGCDLLEFQKTFQHQMGYWGGVDKRAIATGGDVLEKEITRLEPVLRYGGFIPTCDHGVPYDVSWENFLDFTRLLAQATGWL